MPGQIGNGKAAGVLDTPATASNEYSTASLPSAEITGNITPKEYATLQAQFALLGRALTRCHLVPIGAVIYAVSRYGESRYFAHDQALKAYLAQISCAHAYGPFKARAF